jgi:hypothetical protein
MFRCSIVRPEGMGATEEVVEVDEEDSSAAEARKGRERMRNGRRVGRRIMVRRMGLKMYE